MKYLTTIICCLAFAFAGFHLALTGDNKLPERKTTAIYAATLPQIKSDMLPLDLQLDLKKKYQKTDTVYLPGDTVFVETPQSKVINHKRRHASTRAWPARKRLGDSIPAIMPDTLVKNKVDTGREEKPVDTIGLAKSIILVVDGKEVYKR